MAYAKTIEEYFQRKSEWGRELALLRDILLESGLTETLKWGAPAYTCEGKNVVGIGAFKRYFGLWFFQGALLKDEAGVLVNAQRGKTKALRQWRFNSFREVNPELVSSYVREAIENQQKGKTVPVRRNRPVEIPRDLQSELDTNAQLAASFAALSTGKRREYAEYIAEGKRESTRKKRLAKIIPIILQGKGLHDRYRK